ncbi:MAG: bifunctional riboflavin kinase/FAD synthetase [Bacteroidota bacterium]|nr:bifunctional riboflavin kinase/FAD synthetase [Bacteroidota bacterium]
MLVHRDINNLPPFKNSVITIGTFDGVHTGHLQIINQLKKEASEINGESVIITFHPHPRMVVNAKSHAQEAFEEIKLLTTLDEKIELLKDNGIDHLVIVPFTFQFSEQSAEEYITNFLIAAFHPHTIVIGYDHHFGKGRGGDYKLLEAYQEKYNYKVKEIPEHVLHQVKISSTKIRHSLLEGDIETANEALGYAYFFEGKIVEGDKLGRQLGYPTANINVMDKSKLIPCNGVYAVEIAIEEDEKENAFFSKSNFPDKHYKGMMNIGFRPTVGGTKKIIEVNLFDFDKTIYNKIIRVYVRNYLRPEKKFNGLDELKSQLSEDKKKSLQLLEGN